MPPQQVQSDASKEAQIQLALQALKQDANLSLQRAAAIYSVPRKTLSNRRAGRPSRADAMPNSRGLDNNKEQCNLGPVSTNWPNNNTYNFNKAGFMMGIILTGAVVTALERQGRLKTVQPGNREWTTVIKSINARGWAVPPFIIFQGKHHLSAWYQEKDLL
ncbi:hypothetical protein OPT61_g7383 [Boeremia exigua]|uniref:Uncharacterized protein n=1 Tax=Boeremia exigua TaxID=749465 RepID=A0ACC2I467_9PLEO|nr:hypothetical protein OPT61_g7383 [Boeremia exigua]